MENFVDVDGEFEVLQQDEHGVAVRFKATNNVAVIARGEQVFDIAKRRRAEDPLSCYRMAVLMAGQDVAGMGKTVDVITEGHILLDTGVVVGAYLRPKRGLVQRTCDGTPLRKSPAYEKWRRLENVCKEWETFEAFHKWYTENRPKEGWWCLRTITGRWAPGECGFDSRCDAPVDASLLRGGVFVR